jgi:hypothetical protein
MTIGSDVISVQHVRAVRSASREIALNRRIIAKALTDR